MPQKYLFVFLFGGILTGVGLWFSSSPHLSTGKSLFDKQVKPSHVRDISGNVSSQTIDSKSGKRSEKAIGKSIAIQSQEKRLEYWNRLKPYVPTDVGGFTLGKGMYRMLPDLIAIPEHLYDNSQEHVEITRQSGFVYCQPNPQVKLDANVFSVALNESTKQLSVLTSRLKVFLKKEALPQKLEQAYDLELVKFFEHLSMALFTVSSSDSLELINMAKVIGKDPKVERVDIEFMGTRLVSQ